MGTNVEEPRTEAEEPRTVNFDITPQSFTVILLITFECKNFLT